MMSTIFQTEKTEFGFQLIMLHEKLLRDLYSQLKEEKNIYRKILKKVEKKVKFF